MSRETAEQALQIGLAEAQRVSKHLDVSFFGCEPLLEWSLLQHCCRTIQQLAAGSDTRIRFGVTTNGLLLTKQKFGLVGESFLSGGSFYRWFSCYA